MTQAAWSSRQKSLCSSHSPEGPRHAQPSESAQGQQVCPEPPRKPAAERGSRSGGEHGSYETWRRRGASTRSGKPPPDRTSRPGWSAPPRASCCCLRASHHTNEAWRVDQANQCGNWLVGAYWMRPGRRLPYLRNGQTLNAMVKYKTQAIRHDRPMQGDGLAGCRMADAWVRDDDARVPPDTRAARCAGVRG